MRLWMATLMAFSFSIAQAAGSHPLSICGQDERTLSSEPRTGRSVRSGDQAGCTVSMIGHACAISAGHCSSVLDVVNFNTFLDDHDVLISRPEDEYKVDAASIVYRDGGMGHDYSVMKIKPNTVTGRLAGDVQGRYEVATTPLNMGADVVSIGYGRETPTKSANSRQQYGLGKIMVVRGTRIDHSIDTMPGNSGGPLIDASTGALIGIHTHGGCDSSPGVNSGTAIAGYPELQRAISDCLASESQ